jgi:hypothetical protein
VLDPQGNFIWLAGVQAAPQERLYRMHDNRPMTGAFAEHLLDALLDHGSLDWTRRS